MTCEDLYAVILNRGLTPRIGDDGSLVIDEGEQKGPLSGNSRILQKAIKAHETALKRLVAAQWMPPTNQDRLQRTGAVPVPAASAPSARVFDQDAEKLVRDLYAFDYGLKWDREQKRLRITPARRCPRFDHWWKRAKPMWDRIVMHLTDPVPTGSIVVEFRHEHAGKVIEYRQDHPIYESKGKEKGRIIVERGYLHRYVVQEAWITHLKDCEHPFEGEPCVTYNQWRWVGEPGGHWRALWGRHIVGRGGNSEWVRWGHRSQ